MSRWECGSSCLVDTDRLDVSASQVLMFTLSSVCVCCRSCHLICGIPQAVWPIHSIVKSSWLLTDQSIVRRRPSDFTQSTWTKCSFVCTVHQIHKHFSSPILQYSSARVHHIHVQCVWWDVSVDHRLLACLHTSIVGGWYGEQWLTRSIRVRITYEVDSFPIVCDTSSHLER